MTTFSDNKLPLPSQPWGREVTKAITSLESKVESERVNNTARDNQLNSSIIANQAATVKAQSAADDAAAAASDAADAAAAAATAASAANSAATTANNAINAITSLGTPGSSTTVNASNISGGNITGVTFRTAASGQRVELSGTSETFYNSSGYTGSIYGSVDQGSNAITTTSGAGQLSVFGYGGAGGGVFMGGSGTSLLVGDGNLGTVISSQGTTYINGGAFRSNASTNTFANALTISGACDINGGYARVGTGFLQVPDTRTRSLTGGLAVFVATNGTYHVGSSSRRFKQDILDYTVDYDSFLKMNPVTFRYKAEVEESGDSAGTTVGFIAEELEELGLTEYVVLDDNGDPFGINYTNMVVGLKQIVARQDEMIKALTARIEALESKV